jgi:hypothetical protein
MKYALQLCVLALALCSMAGLRAADAWDKARVVAEKTSACAVRVRVVSELKMDMRGQNVEREQKSEIDGTVIDPCGLTLVSATALNPSSLLSRMMRGMKVEMNVKETTLILADGTEVAAEVVLKDTELDMAFIRPKEGGKTYAAVSLKPHTTPPQPLDDVFVVGRLGKNANRTPFIDAGKIRSCVKGPRPYYICSREVSDTSGCVVYTIDGEPLGVVLVQKAPSEDGGQAGMGIMMGGGGDLAIVRPVEDIIDAAKQALEAKPATETKPAAEGKPAEAAK